MSDGVKLAARIWMPVDAVLNPQPAILEYLPYRKDDGTAERDSARHPYFAGFGYVSIRVDMRGTGDSGGILNGEYLPQEQDDALEVLRWITSQKWCNGRVGIIGISWGGFNGLQIAMRRPKELKAVISLCSTDDRYNNDCHYMGGCVLGSDMLAWASNMLAYNALPPDPKHIGRDWKKVWLKRLKRTPRFVESWISHQFRDQFWKQGSVCENYDSIKMPVFVVGGWADSYVDSVLRLLENLSCPRIGLIGPWAHRYPEDGQPGPAIGFLQECLRWWDYWLKDIDTGIMNEPILRVWIGETNRIMGGYNRNMPSGYWTSEKQWPAKRNRHLDYYLRDGKLDRQFRGNGVGEVSVFEGVGLDSGVWCPQGVAGDFPGDQRDEEGGSLFFTSPPLSEQLEVLGVPIVNLVVESDRPNALLAVRLCDVASDGTSTRVSWGLLNLTHGKSHERPQSLIPGKKYKVTIRLKSLGYRFAKNNRIRIDISSTYWPQAWPSPQEVNLKIHYKRGTVLRLPVRKTLNTRKWEVFFHKPEGSKPLAVKIIKPSSRKRFITRDLITGKYVLEDIKYGGKYKFVKSGIVKEELYKDKYSIVEKDPLSARVDCKRDIFISMKKWHAAVKTESSMWGGKEFYFVSNKINAFGGKKKIFDKTWNFKTRRKMV